jgi:hypothetical protein
LGPLGRIKRPVTQLCEGRHSRFWYTPTAFRQLPQDVRISKAKSVLGPVSRIGASSVSGLYFVGAPPSRGKGRDAGHLPHRRQRRRQGSVEASLRTRRNTAIQVRFPVSDLPT